MINEVKAQKQYLAGYQAFEQGDYCSATALADTCMILCPQTSYWYAGALGLKCWIASFTNNLANLEQTAASLLELDAGTDKPWFDGIALLNLGLARRRAGNTAEAHTFLLRAAKQYETQQLWPEQPSEWQNVLDYFSILSKWAVSEEAEIWKELLDRLRGDDTDEPSELVCHLTSSAQLMLRYAEGHDVKREADALVNNGVSRTFLVVLLIE